MRGEGDELSGHHSLAARAAPWLTPELEARYRTLSPRERQVMGLAVRGLMNKQIAGEVGTSEITVKIHRGNAMRKMEAKTFADLVRMAEALAPERET